MATEPTLFPAAPMDDDMRAFSDAAARAAANYPNALTSPVPVARQATEDAQRPLAQGGPEMYSIEEKWVFGPGRYILCRVYHPVKPTGPVPALVFIHGGGWVLNSIYTHDRLAREYAARAGIAVVAPDYSLAPEYKFPLALEECIAVLRWLSKEGAAWNIDGSRLVVGGDSAGGNLSAGALLALKDRGETFLRGGLLNYPVMDSITETDSYKAFSTGHGLTGERMRWFWNAYVASPDQLTHPYAAPLRGDFKGLPPLRFNIAGLDPLASEGIAGHHKAKAAGVDTECVVYPGVLHGFMRALAQVKRGEQAVAESADWLKRILKP